MALSPTSLPVLTIWHVSLPARVETATKENFALKKMLLQLDEQEDVRSPCPSRTPLPDPHHLPQPRPNRDRRIETDVHVLQLFVTEVANHRRLQHPNVCPVLDSVVRVGKMGRKEGLILLPLYEVRLDIVFRR